MEAVFLRLSAVAFLSWPAGNAPLDVSPPLPEPAAAPNLGGLVVLGVMVVVVILASIFVIRRIKKRRAQRERS